MASLRFEVAQRVQLNAPACRVANVFMKDRYRFGVVQSINKRSGVPRVLWDGYKKPQEVAWRFLEEEVSLPPGFGTDDMKQPREK